jgi:phosphatidylserine/phosphatidylglycerophosphate/cardiolipin synthase-like enzyme
MARWRSRRGALCARAEGLPSVALRTSLALGQFAEGDTRFVAAPSHPYHAGDTNDLMHNKLMILDDTVITGSYNFSENAESNDENLLVLKSHEVAGACGRSFDATFAEYRRHGASLPPV